MATITTRPPEQRDDPMVYVPQEAEATPQDMSVTLANRLGNTHGAGSKMTEAELMFCLRKYQRLQVEGPKYGPEFQCLVSICQMRIDQALRRIRALRDAKAEAHIRARDDDLLPVTE